MGFIRNLLRNREKRHLEESILEKPTPPAFLRLARIYQEEGDLAKARQIAKRGAAKFPDSSEIGSAEQDLARLDREAECARLRDRIERYPNPRLYSRLAELYRAGGEAEKGRETTRLGLRNYPDYGGLHYVNGELARDAGQLEEACQHLTKATELDSYNYSALKILGEVLTGLGRSAEAAGAYGKILAFAPDDEEVKALREKVLADSGETAPAEAAGLAQVTSPTRDTRVLSTGETAPTISESSELGGALSELVAAAGVEGALLVDNYGLPVASALPVGTEEALAAAMVTGLRRSASPSSGELGLGAFEEMTIESIAGGLYVYALQDMTLAVFTAPEAKAGLVERRVQAFAEKALELH